MTNSNQPCEYDTSVLLHTRDMPFTPLTIDGLERSLRGKILRTLTSGQPRSIVIEFSPGQVVRPCRVAHTLQLFVLSGSLAVEGRPLNNWGFLVVEGGKILPEIHVTETTTTILIFDGDQRFEPTDASVIEEPARLYSDARTVEPFVPVVNGRKMTGFARRVLWLDKETGADTRLLTIPAGFEGGGPGWHPVNEEIYCLDGDVAPDDTRPLQAGSFLWNPSHSVHGFHEHSVGGCTLLEWHDGDWAYIPYDDSVPFKGTPG